MYDVEDLCDKSNDVERRHTSKRPETYDTYEEARQHCRLLCSQCNESCCPMVSSKDVEGLCDKLNNDEITYNGESCVWSPKHPAIRPLRWLPASNFNELQNVDFSKVSDFSELREPWGRAGLLKFEPYTQPEKESENPTLTIRYNRHLHLFRGYYFQVSYTPDGTGSADIGSYRIGFLINHGAQPQLWQDSILVNMLCYAAVIDAAYIYDNFKEWVAKNTDAFDTFVHNSFNYWGMHLRLKWKDLQKHIHVDDCWRSLDRDIYRVSVKNKIICEFAFGKRTVQVRTTTEDGESKVLTIEVPFVLDGIDEPFLYNMDDITEFRRSVEKPGGAYNSNEDVPVKMILVMAMALSGIKINWYTCYSTVKRKALRATNTPHAVDVSSLRDISEREPDIF